MIRVAIDGADSDDAGRLLRLLINHPDVHIVAAVAPASAGLPVTKIHKGLIGDIDTGFSDEADLDHTDVLFIAPGGRYADIDLQRYPSLKVIDMQNAHPGNPLYITGLPELYRKAMVRDGRAVSLVSGACNLLVTALLPLAKNLLLTGDIDVQSTYRCLPDAHVAGQSLAGLQSSFDGAVNWQSFEYSHTHCAIVVAKVRCSIDMGHLNQLYLKFFDDHNFVHIVGQPPQRCDVAATAKTLINLQTDGQTLTVTAAHDPLMRGCAATAVHCLNLLFGLHERTALVLAPLAYD